MQRATYQGVCVIFTIGTLLFASIYGLASLWPKYEERFVAMGVLGRNMKAEEYYPGNDSTVRVGDTLIWYINLYNHWDKDQNVSILVKVLNATNSPPDDLKNEPSPIPPIMDMRLLLNENETRIIPFTWQIEEAKFTWNTTALEKLAINNQTIPLNVYGEPRSLFRMVFELWLFNQETGRYEYGWYPRDLSHRVWNGIWINVTSSS